ncbi:MAG TPA: NADH-quinone oxidoreductase subunit N [Dehalococcoidia bacterium]|jgi:NADH-quinone oxidoreductase subunit N|nr:NADH-quinone oxidoreductase subunit N [Dehalococcoidia bacterium]
MSNHSWELLAPEMILVGWAAVIVLADLFWGRIGKEPLGWFAALGAFVACGVSLIWVDDSRNFGGLIDVNDYTTLFRVFFTLVGGFACIASARYVKQKLLHPGEYYALILLCVVGADGMAAADELITAYISLELLSFSLYILTGYSKFDLRSNEAGLKYNLLGAFSSAVLLYGIAMMYGVTGTTTYAEIAARLTGDISDIEPAMFLGLALIIGGIGFKVAAVPFHMYTPDAYEGAPLPITGLISALSKSAGIALFLKLFVQGFLPIVDDWKYFIAGLAVATMAVGNLVALQQTNIKRLLAYSSIAQVGYLLVGLAALDPANHDAASALVLHMVGYVATNLAAFVAIIIYYNWTGREEIPEFKGLAERAPFLALCLTIALFSLSGMPLFAGFATKFILFQAAANHDLLWLAGIAAFFSFVSLYYYLVVIREMYLGEPDEKTRFPTPWFEYGALSLLVAGIFFVGLYPRPIFDAVQTSTDSIFPPTAAGQLQVVDSQQP